jgi:aryl-alcohol dehydrogenase-like predicted oxidoreductase
MRRKEFLKILVSGLAGTTLAGLAKETGGNSPGQGRDANLLAEGNWINPPEKKHGEWVYDSPNSKAPRYQELGKTGFRVSTIGFGVSRTMEPALVLAVLEAGINFMDTGRSYFRGQNEVMVGRVLGVRRKEVIIQSKLRVNLTEEQLKSREDINRALKQMEDSLAASLRALNTDYIDIMLIHGAEQAAVVHHPEIMKFFEEKKKEGAIRAHGFSTHLKQVELVRAENGVGFYDVIMTTYNHKGAYVHMNTGRKSSWDQEALESELRLAREKGVGLVAMKTCSGGPYAPSAEARPSYAGALRWIMQRNVVHTMAVAMASHEQIRENLGVWD